jgi:GH35 family endo-1,4-beta-xylanase
MKKLTLILGIGVFAAALAAARDPLYDKLWHDPEVEQRIRTGIENNRMGFATLRFVDAQGKPVTNVEVDFRQTSHDFLFGSNIFALNGFSSAEQNRRYEDAFHSTFNYATAPFYWSDLEPEPGRLRFGVDSPFVPRRPPPDAVLEFCRRHHITVKGHNLIWHSWYPQWLPRDQVGVTRLVRQRFEQIAERYGKNIPIWDVVNEPLERRPDVILPKDYVYWAMQEAQRVFPPEDTLLVNEVTSVWTNFHWEDSPFYLLLQNLALRHVRVDGIGLQFHLFSEQLYRGVLAGKAVGPRDLLRVLDQYGEFQKPIHITEITVPTFPNTPQGEADQAEVVRNLYRLWFSHPNVEAITWWNVADGTAVEGENKWGGGLLRKDLSPKLSYDAVNTLIHKEWQTHLTRNSDSESDLRLRGFYGEYAITARHNGKTVTRHVHLSKSGQNEFIIEL